MGKSRIYGNKNNTQIIVFWHMAHKGGCVVGCPRLCVSMWELDLKVTSSSAVSYLNSKTRLPLKLEAPWFV